MEGPNPVSNLLFSRDGMEFRQDTGYFEYRDGQYTQTKDGPPPQVEVGDYPFTLEEWPEGGTWNWPAQQIRYESELEFDAIYGAFLQRAIGGITMYVGPNRDYLFVDSINRSAQYLVLPIEAPCYFFQLYVNKFGGYHITNSSCLMETGNALLYQNRPVLGYDPQLWSARP